MIVQKYTVWTKVKTNWKIYLQQGDIYNLIWQGVTSLIYKELLQNNNNVNMKIKKYKQQKMCKSILKSTSNQELPIKIAMDVFL